jgi:type I restriction enzyme S subunit
MATEWRDITLGDFVSLQRGHDLTEPERRAGQVPVMGSAGLNGFHDTARAKGPGLVIGRSGASFGQVHFSVTDYWPHNTALYVTDFKGNDPLFAYYFLKALNFERFNSGSAQPSLNRNFIYPIPIRVPKPSEQKAIAAVLGALDDKIELNRRMNATLEAMARALFQSWFVDFDPVRAKQAGRQPPGMDAATAALFPDSFKDSELGHIPEGWSISTVGAELSALLGGTPSRSKPEYWTSGSVPWINSGKTNEFRIIEPSEWITKEALLNSATKLLPRRTTVLAITGATLGQVSIAEIECCANQSVVAILASGKFPTEFIYPWIEENIEKLIASQTGGAQQHINKGNIEELPLLSPDEKILHAYLEKSKPLFDQIAANCFQSRTLGTLRDTLLPKLLSGQISSSIPESTRSS